DTDRTLAQHARVLESHGWTRHRHAASAPLPKFVIHRGRLGHELRKQRGTSKSMILVPLFDLKFLNERAASGVGTSNRRRCAASCVENRCPRSESRSRSVASTPVAPGPPEEFSCLR